MAQRVAGELYESITGQLFETGRQLRQKGGYPFDPEKLRVYLQMAIEGRFRLFQTMTTIDVTEPFDPAEFIGQKWGVWKGPADGDGLSGEEDVDGRSLAISVIDPTQILLERYLKEGESWIVGEEKLRRMKDDPNKIRSGGNVFLGLWKDYEANGENSVLERLYQERRVTYLDFFGLVLRSPVGNRYVLFLYRDDDGGWYWDVSWLDRDWDADDLSAVFASADS